MSKAEFTSMAGGVEPVVDPNLITPEDRLLNQLQNKEKKAKEEQKKQKKRSPSVPSDLLCGGNCHKKYLHITCPAKGCDQDLALVCPYCLKGALKCHETNYILQCSNCQASLQGINCTCGFTIKSAYIHKKQKKLMEMIEVTETSGYKTIATTFGVIAVLVYLTSMM